MTKSTETLQDIIQSIQDKANAQMEDIMQEQYGQVVAELRKRYPKRKVEVRFGMGTVVVSGFENTRYDDCDIFDTVYLELPKGHPLRRLYELVQVTYPSTGHCICCEDITL